VNPPNLTRFDRLTLALSRAWGNRRIGYLVVVLALVLALSYFYAFLASAGTFKMLEGHPAYYDRMCEGFRAGHLYILEQPQPALLAKKDPYADENFFENLWLWDASLYKGHYYMYWGPVPGLLLLAWKLLTGEVGVVNDQWATVCYMIGRLVFGTGLILGLAKYQRAVPPIWLVALAIGVFGLAGPIPFIVSRPDVYEASLAAGQCFLFAGLWSTFLGIVNEKKRTPFFLVASVMWTMAFGSRATALIPVVFFVIATVYFVWYRLDRSWSRAIRNTLALGIPFACGVVAYGVYNYLRFDSPFEFGTHYQVTLQRFTTHAKYILPNVYSYLLAPLKTSCAFPFVETIKYRKLVKFITWPAGYMVFEKMGGLLWMNGLFWLHFLPLSWGIRAYWRRWSPSCVPRYPTTPWVYVWALFCSVGLTLSLVPALGLWEASMRYAGDAVGGMAIAAIVTAFCVIRRCDESRFVVVKYLARLLVVVLGLHCCFVGALTAFTPADEHFQLHNPTLFKNLADTLSFCN
jgi:hypothetical protein